MSATWPDYDELPEDGQCTWCLAIVPRGDLTPQRECCETCTWCPACVKEDAEIHAEEALDGVAS